MKFNTPDWFTGSEQQLTGITEALDANDPYTYKFAGSTDFHINSTPFNLCFEIVDRLHKLNFVEGKWLIVANIEFVYVVKKYFEYRGWNINNIYFVTPCKLKKVAVEKLGIMRDNIGIYNYQQLNIGEGFNNMKFDVIVGNPPYQDPNSVNTKNLWPDFLNKSFSLSNQNGYVSLITPRTWTTNELYNNIFLKYNPICINVDECAKYFPGIGSTFSYYILQNTKPITHDFEVTLKDGSIILNHLPENGLGVTSPIALSILNKTATGRYFPVITSSGYNTMKFSKDDPTVSWNETPNHPYKILHKKLKKEGYVYFYSSLLDKKTYNVPRVVMSIWVANYKDMEVSAELLTCEQFRHFPTTSMEEANVLKTVLTSKLYHFLAKSYVSGGSFTNKSVSTFPIVDLTKTWTDQELYQQFNLTQDEINLVEGTIK